MLPRQAGLWPSAQGSPFPPGGVPSLQQGLAAAGTPAQASASRRDSLWHCADVVRGRGQLSQNQLHHPLIRGRAHRLIWRDFGDDLGHLLCTKGCDKPSHPQDGDRARHPLERVSPVTAAGRSGGPICWSSLKDEDLDALWSPQAQRS